MRNLGVIEGRPVEIDKLGSTVVLAAAGAWLLKMLVANKLDELNTTLKELTHQMASVTDKVSRIEVKQEYHERWIEELDKKLDDTRSGGNETQL